MSDSPEEIREAIKYLESENAMMYDDILDAKSAIEKNDRSIARLKKQLDGKMCGQKFLGTGKP